jgi:hypothetical protein
MQQIMGGSMMMRRCLVIGLNKGCSGLWRCMAPLSVKLKADVYEDQF